MKVKLMYNHKGKHARLVRAAVERVNATQNFFFINANYSLDSHDNYSPVDPEEEYRKLGGDSVDERFIVITEERFIDNWFSHEYRMGAIITTSDWEEMYAPPSLISYICFQIAQALLHFAGDLSEDVAMNIVHVKPVGCMMDFCGHKEHIKLGMVSGNLCPSCQATLRVHGISQNAISAIERILDIIRCEATGRPRTLQPNQAFIVMRYTNNDENDNAYKYGIKSGLQKLGLNPLRSDNRVESTQILSKIHRQISESRFVIAKVDENNLNVYFELGLAMGQNKEVLLVSEKDLCLNLPSDLRNWECLTYSKGNYEELREAVEKYYRDNFWL